MIKLKIKPYKGSISTEINNTTTQGEIRKLKRFTRLVGATLLLLALAPACGTQKEVPVKTETIIRDSIIYKERIDTTWITLPPVYIKDYTALRDTLHLSSPYAVAWAAVDEGKELLVGAIESTDKQIPVHTLEVEKVIKKDTLIYKEIPYEVEKPVRYIPRWCWWSLVFNVLGMLGACLLVYLKIRKIL